MTQPETAVGGERPIAPELTPEDALTQPSTTRRTTRKTTNRKKPP
jgi:hypothetical protein